MFCWTYRKARDSRLSQCCWRQNPSVHVFMSPALSRLLQNTTIPRNFDRIFTCRSSVISSYCRFRNFLPRHKNFIFCSSHPAMPLSPMLHLLTVGHTALWSDACQLTTNNLNNARSATCCVTFYSELWIRQIQVTVLSSHREKTQSG